MLLRIIGCWAPFPRAGEACSGYLLSSDTSHLLLDCGHAVSSCLPRWLPPEQLDAVVISHFHPDHYADLYAIRHAIRAALRAGSRRTLLKVYMPAQPEQEYLAFTAMPELEIIPLTAGSVFATGDIQVRAFPVTHSLTAFGIRAESGGRSLAYTADTAWSRQLVDEVRGVDLLLCESSLQMADGQFAADLGHLSTGDAGNIARESGAGCLVATHFWPGYDVEALRREIARVYQGKLVMAAQDLAIEV